MTTNRDESSEQEHFLVAPRSLGQQGVEVLGRFLARARQIPGATVPDLDVKTNQYVAVVLPPGAAAALRSEFGDALIFEPNAPLRY
jgi:hypothetical protein